MDTHRSSVVGSGNNANVYGITKWIWNVSIKCTMKCLTCIRVPPGRVPGNYTLWVLASPEI